MQSLMKNDCQQCRQPLEEWEAGFCEGCGIVTNENNHEMTHSEKIKFWNAVVDLANRYHEISRRMTEVLRPIDRMECMHITPQLAKSILNNLPNTDTESEESQVEVFKQKFFS